MEQPVVQEQQNTEQETLLTRRARFALNISRILFWAPIPMIVALMVGWLAFQQYIQLPMLAGAGALIFLTGILFPALHRRGQTVLGFYILIGCMTAVLVLGGLLLPEMLPGIAIAFALLPLMSFLLLGDRAGRWASAGSGLVFLGGAALSLTVARGWFAESRLPQTAAIVTAIAFVAFAAFAMVLLIRTIVLEQETQFERAQKANRELARRAASEKEQRQFLLNIVEQFKTAMAEVARGNLTVRVPVYERGPDDPFADLGRSLNETIAGLQQIASQVRQGAENISATAAEILAATTQQAAGASEQSAAIAQASTTIDEVRSIAEQTAQRAQGVAELSRRTTEVSHAGQQAVADTIAGMQDIRQKVEAIATGILSLSEQTQAIGQIIATVNEIAAQSNMLALNAAVEAARAGEAGKGFAVVAGEVRALAEQSRAATAQVRDILTEIQRGVNAAVMATEEGMKGADGGMRLTQEAGAAIRRLAESINESAEAAVQIAAAATQQVAGMEQIALAMQNIHQVTAQTVAATRQSERAAQDLNALAGSLAAAAGQYRL